MSFRNSVAAVLVALLSTGSPLVCAQQPGRDTARVRAAAEQLGAGAFVLVTFRDGARVRGTLLNVTSTALSLQPKTRIPVDPQDLPLSDVVSIELQREGMSAGTKVLVWVGVGAGAVWLALMGLAAAASN